MIDKQVECPVCSLYLREGMSMQGHLNTHPKDQVIEALVRFSGVGGSNVQSPSKQQNNQGQPVEAPAVPNQLAVGGSVTSLTYQQFMNSGTAIFPNLVQVPALVSQPPFGSIPYACSPNSVMQMVYNPYVVPQNNQGNDELIRQMYMPTLQANAAPTFASASVSANQAGSVPASTASNVNVSATASSSVDDSSRSESLVKPASCNTEPNANDEIQCLSTSCAFQTDFPDPEYGAECNSSHSAGPSSGNTSPYCVSDDDCLPCSEDAKVGPDFKIMLDSATDEVITGMDDSALRVRTDLNSKPQEENYNADETVTPIEHSSIAKNISDLNLNCPVTSVQESVPEPEYITSDPLMETNQRSLVVKKKSVLNQIEPVKVKQIVDLDSSSPVNIIEIDGIHIIIPSQLLDNPDLLEAIAPNLPVIQGPDNEHENEPSGEATVKDIQTDERMPPRGELSEQESIGDNENSVGSNTTIQPYREMDEPDSAVYNPSYDLLAMETWDASDGSDADRPSTPLTEEPVAEKLELPEMKPEPSKKSKIKQKKVYTCLTCKETFDCPKERRVHQKMQHGECSGTSGGVSAPTLLALPSSDSLHGDSGECSTRGGPQGSMRAVRSRRVYPGRRTRSGLGAKGVNSAKKKTVKCEQPVTQNKDSINKIFGLEESEDKTVTSKLVVPLKKEDGDSSLKIETPKIEDGCSKKEDTANYPCSECNAMFTSEKAVMNHKRLIHKCVVRKCSICDKVFETAEEFTEHLKEHPLECLHCGKCFLRKQNLRLHVNRHLGIRNHKCSVCDRAFLTKQKLGEHLNSHTGVAPLKCSMCSKTFRRYSNLIQHKNGLHLKIKKKVKDFFCHCGEIFHSKKKLNWHKEIHDPKPKSCTFCSERFVHTASLTRHIRQMHDRKYIPQGCKNEENVECPVCSNVYLKSSLHIHMRVHSGERPFGCNICGKEFTTKWNLQLHRWIHASRSSKPFKCNLCKNAYVRKSDYVSHMRSHKNMRPFTCNYCGCQFIRRYNCLRHVKEHESGKSYQCTVCNKTFHRSYYLKEHFRVHTGQRPYVCHVCGKASSTKSNHNKHVRIHHAREPVNSEG